MMHTPRHLFVFAAALALTACGGGDDPVAETGDAPAAAADGAADDGAADTAEILLVSPQEASEIAVADGVVVLDVRTPAEFAEGHLAGAELLDFNSGEFAATIGDYDRDGKYLVYCRSDNRSGQAVAIMAELGFRQVWDVDGGIVAWNEAGLPLQR